MDSDKIVELLNERKPPFLSLLGGEIREAERDIGRCVMHFDISKEYCHSVDVVQGGFVTAMLDAVSSHAVFVTDPNIINVSTLELKVSFFAPTRAGLCKAVGKIEKKGRKIAFVSAELFSPDGTVTASLTATAKMVMATKTS